MDRRVNKPSPRPGQNDYEMSTTRPRNETNGSLVINDMPSFWNAVDQVEANLRTFKGNVTNISSMQSRLLNSMGNSSIEQRLEALIAETRVLSHTLRNQIKQLEATGSQTEQGVRRTKRAELLKSQFLQALQEYQTAEQKHRQAQRDQIAHQMRLVKPNATDDEVNAAVNDTPNGQVFQQALMHSDQLGRARNAYQDVQARHQELVRINETITELAQLMADMALYVEQQGNVIDTIEKTTEVVAKDTERGLDETSRARKLAKLAREKKKWCFLIAVIILVIIAIIVGVYVGVIRARNSN